MTKSLIHRIWLKNDCWDDYTIKSPNYYSVFTRRLVLSLGYQPDSCGRPLSVGVTSKEKQYYFPAIPRLHLSRIVGKPPEATKTHPLLTHWSSRERSEATDTERVRTLTATSSNLRKRVLPIFEDVQFPLAFRMLPVRSRFWFLKDMQPNIILCIQPSCGAVEVDLHLFFDCDHTAQLWLELLPTALDEHCMRNCASSTDGVEGVSADFVRFVASTTDSDSTLRLERSKSHIV